LFKKYSLKNLTDFETILEICVIDIIVELGFYPTNSITAIIAVSLENSIVHFLGVPGLVNHSLWKEFCREIKQDKIFLATKLDTKQFADKLRIQYCHEIIKKQVRAFNADVLKKTSRSFYTPAFLKNKGRQEQIVSRDIFGVIFAGLYPIKIKKQSRGRI
jgi:hypothetical protein